LSYEYALRGAAGILMDGPPHDPEQSAYAAIRAVLTGRTERGPEPAAITVYAEGAAKATEESRRVSSIENVWGAALNRFFMAALISRQPSRPIKIVAEPLAPNRQDRPGDKRFLRPNISPVFWMKAGEEVAPGTESPRDAFSFYLGPAGENELANYEPRLGADAPTHLNLAVQYCDVGSWRWPNIDRLARLLLWLFNLIASVTSYGLAVILLTLVIKLALHPLQRKMTVSMYKMQQLQPKLKAIEDKYGNVTDPKIKQKKELEKLDLMRKEGAKPWSGCLPMFLQVPIFFALFGAFSHAFEIRQAGFLWIADLSLADRLVTFSFWPQEINLLPLLYAALSLYQGLTQPKPANEDPQQALQRKMFLVMPVVISFIFYRMPSGLVLYFTASSIFGLLENWFIKRYVLKIGSDGKPLVPATAATATPAKKGR
jgi:YidC/Oxa1 family membrane protein insertase